MVDQVRRGQSWPRETVSDHDLVCLRLMLSENTEWVVTTHRGHITSIKRVSPALVVQQIPLWWLQYATANNIDL